MVKCGGERVLERAWPSISGRYSMKGRDWSDSGSDPCCCCLRDENSKSRIPD